MAEAERCWAAAQAAKAAYGKKLANDQGAAREKQQVINKLNRASQHSDILLSLLRKANTPALQEAEAAIYHLFLKSNYYFEKGAWESAIVHLEKTRQLLDLLVEKTTSQNSQALAYELLDEIQPISRVATTKASQKTSSVVAKSVEGYEDLLSNLQAIQADESKSQTLTQLDWRNGETISLRNAGLAVAVSKALRIVNQGKQGSRVSMKKFDRSLSALSEAEDVARKLVDDNQVRPVI